MVGLVAGLWGLFGGFAVEGLELYAAWQRYRRWPWQRPGDSEVSATNGADQELGEVGVWGYIVAETIRLLIGAGLAWAAAATGQISGPLGALGVGAAAPTIIGQLMRAVPLELPQPAPLSSTAPPLNGQVRGHPSIHQQQSLRAEQSEPEPAVEGEG
jgi:hypothetical protein